MDGGADPFILWHKNESAERNGEGEAAKQKKFSPIQAAGGSGKGPPRLSEENFQNRSRSGQQRKRNGYLQPAKRALGKARFV